MPSVPHAPVLSRRFFPVYYTYGYGFGLGVFALIMFLVILTCWIRRRRYRAQAQLPPAQVVYPQQPEQYSLPQYSVNPLYPNNAYETPTVVPAKEFQQHAPQNTTTAYAQPSYPPPSENTGAPPYPVSYQEPPYPPPPANLQQNATGQTSLPQYAE